MSRPSRAAVAAAATVLIVASGALLRAAGVAPHTVIRWLVLAGSVLVTVALVAIARRLTPDTPSVAAEHADWLESVQSSP